MLITKPDYFDRFQCIADRCPDSCCKEWDVQVDPASAAAYRALSGPLGDRLREVLHTENGETVMTILDGRCPMWRSDGLCRIQAELGESALCKTCREFPRLTHDYGDFLELQLELSCPEAANLILSQKRPEAVSTESENDPGADYDEEAMALLKATRETVLDILFNPSHSVPEALALALLYGYQVQGELDGQERQPFDAHTALDSIQEFLNAGSPQEMADFFLTLELLTPQWKELLHSPSPTVWTDHYRALAAYLIQRYWLQAVSDYDLYCRIKFVVISCLLIYYLGGDIFRTAQLFSKEIENNIDNVEAILDAAYHHPAFTDDKILGMLLSSILPEGDSHFQTKRG